MPEKIRFAIAGMGGRGRRTYGRIIKAMPELAEVYAIAEIDPQRLADAAREFNIPAERCFASAEEMLEKDKLADALIVATQDRQHVGHALPGLRRGYDVLLEKPISPELDQCREIVRVMHETGRRVVVCHVLRYTPFYRKLKEILDTGVIGDIVSVAAMERVGYWHQAHSFVRGNWRDTKETSPMILAKCCHDMDLYPWLTGKRCASVSSIGNTYLFKKEKAPQGAAARCLDGCAVKESCPFDAEKIYITDPVMGIASGNANWPVNVLAESPSVDSVRQALREGPYGRCVYHCDNDTVDHQEINMAMEDGSSISFTMCGLTNENVRYARFMGTNGEIVADMEANTIETQVFGHPAEVVDINKLGLDLTGHSGGDTGLIEEFVAMLRGELTDSNALSLLDESVESHYIALGAEKSRLENGKPVTIADMRA